MSKQYIVVTAETKHGLEEAVNHWMEFGGNPLGGPVTLNDETFGQAMLVPKGVKLKEE